MSRFSKTAFLFVTFSLASFAVAACGGSPEAAEASTSVSESGGIATVVATPTAVPTESAPEPTPTVTHLGADGYGQIPGEVQTRLGVLASSATYGRIGETATAVFEVHSNAGWICGGERSVPGGIRFVSFSVPSGTKVVSFKPTELTRETASIKSDPGAVTWRAGESTAEPIGCKSGQGNTTPTGFFKTGDVFEVTFEVDRALRPMAWVGSTQVTRPWSKVSVGMQNEQSGATASLPHLALEKGEYARVLAVNGVVTPAEFAVIDPDFEFEFRAEDWDPNGGTVQVKLGDEPIFDFSDTEFHGTYTLKPGLPSCGVDLVMRQGQFSRTLTLAACG